MFIKPVDVDNTANFLLGFRVSYFASQEKIPGDWVELYVSILNEMGLRESAKGPVCQMREKDMTDEQIMNKLIDIEINMLKKQKSIV